MIITIDEQQKQIDEQQKQIDEQQKQIDSLRAMVTEMASDKHLAKLETKGIDLQDALLYDGTGSWRLRKLEEKIGELEAHLGEDDYDTPRWLKGKTIHEQISQVIIEHLNAKPLSVSDVEKISKTVVKEHLGQSHTVIEGDFKDIWARLCKLEDATTHSFVAERLTKLEKLVSNGVTLRDFDKLHEEVNDIHLSLLESEKKLKSQLKSIWHDGVRGTKGQASLHGLNLRLNGAEIALEKLEKGLSNSNAFTTDVEQRICDDINSLRKLMLANIKDVRLLKARGE